MKALALAVLLTVGLVSVSVPRMMLAQAAAQQDDQKADQKQDQKQDQKAGNDSGPFEEIKGHGRKIIRPGADVEPIFVWRRGATLATLIALAGALFLSLPVAAVYEFTSKKRTSIDRGVTQSILLLPPIVAGIVMVVQNSLALAFSLAGVATTVRFRSSLKDTNDAAYIFLAIAIGIATGAQALDVAAVVSAGSCAAALIVFGIGTLRKDPAAETPPAPPSSSAPKKSDTPKKADTPVNGSPNGSANGSTDDAARNSAIIVSAPHDEHARAAVESLLDGLTKEWRLDNLENNSLDEEAHLRYVIRTKKRLDIDAVISAINAAGASQGIHAEVDHAPAPAPAPDPAPATSS